MFCFLFLAPYARTTRYDEAFFSLENQGKKDLLRSRASLQLSKLFKNGPGMLINTRCRAWLDQLYTNYSKTSTKRLH